MKECWLCGKKIKKMMKKSVLGFFCQRCFNLFHSKCSDCGTIVPDTRIEFVNDEKYCEKCAYKHTYPIVFKNK